MTPASSASGQGNGSASASLTVPEGAKRYLAVGVSTVESATVTGVSFGPQVLTRLASSAKDSSRAEVWTLLSPNVGTATVTVTLSNGSAVVMGATSFSGVDPYSPITGYTSANSANANNSAGLVLNGTVEADGMFGTLTVNDAANIGALNTRASTDTVVADRQWNLEQGTVAGGGATRRGHTGMNMALNSGIGWGWTRVVPSNLMPQSNILVGLKAATIDPPTVSSPTATAVTHTTATLGGTVSDNGGGALTSRGVAYCQCPDPKFGGAGVTKIELGADQTLGAFSTAVAGLKPSTTYTYAAYAGNAFATRYTDPATFKTDAPPNLPPTVSAGGPYTIAEGSSLTLAGNGTDPEGQPLTFAWDLNGDNQFEDALGATPTLTPAQLSALGLANGPISRSIRLAVSDGVHVKISDATTLTVTNVAPTATLTGSTVDEGETATVTFSEQADPVDTSFTYEYAVDGAAFKAGDATLSVPTTDGPGTIPVKGAIIDSDGGRTEYNATVQVRNVAPTAKLDDQTITEGDAATIRLTDIEDAAADKAAGFTYAYDLDGTGFKAGGASVTLPATDGPATIPVKAAITDKDGGRREYSATITVVNVSPTATLAGSTVKEGSDATVTFSDQADAFDTTFTYEYDVDGAGFQPGGATLTLPTTDGPGKFTVKGAILDKDGGRREYTTTVNVENVAPTATLTGSTVKEDQDATVTFSGADDVSSVDKATGFTYEYSVDNGGFVNGGASLTVPTTDGPATLPVRAVIVDKDGGRREYTTTITVENTAPVVTIAGPETVPASGEVTLKVGATDADTLTGTVDWGDGTVVPFAAGDVSHTYAGPGARTVTVRVTDKDGAEGTATHALVVASLPAPTTPTPTATPAPTTTPPSGGVLGAVESNVRISRVQVTPRCIRAEGLKAVSSAAKTIKVQFRLNTAADVKFSLKRAKDKTGFTHCPPAKGVAQKGGRKVPGVYSPFSGRAVTANKGLNTVTLAATGRKGKTLKPGTYLLTISAGDVSVRTKVWVLAQ
ncbi:PKD domain-containing protein [Solirubrobacter taibaiensis]|nr:PKD domain-containing protein [Solirubrobacter taibaiensis]